MNQENQKQPLNGHSVGKSLVAGIGFGISLALGSMLAQGIANAINGRR